MRYRATHFWSMRLGCEASRVSLQDKHGGEHFAIIPQDDSGPANRRRIYETLDVLEAHIKAGNDPGEVSFD